MSGESPDLNPDFGMISWYFCVGWRCFAPGILLAAPKKNYDVCCSGLELSFANFLPSSAFRKRPGAILEAPGTLPDQILRGFCDTFLQVACGSCQGLSGSAGMLPGSAPSLSNPFAGFPWGTAIREAV